jgi:hypothetical protein
MSEVYSALGSDSSSLWASDGWSAQEILDYVQTQLDSGQSVMIGTSDFVPWDSPLIGDHAYAVDHVVTDASGQAVAVVLRNPWGFDGTYTDGNSSDGYVTVTADQLQAAMSGVQSAWV